MPTFKMPLSGDVAQNINPMTWWMSPVGSQFGVVNINMGLSSEPKIEEEILSDVASYGKQIGRIADALAVLIRRLPPDSEFNAEEQKAIDGLKDLVNEVAKVKERHGRRAIRL